MNILLTGASGFLGHHLADKMALEIDKINEQKEYYGDDLFRLFTPPSTQMDCLNYDEVYYYLAKTYFDNKLENEKRYNKL